MDDPQGDEVEAKPPGALRRGARSPRPDRTFVPATAAVEAARGQAIAAAETPLINSRSLGALLRLASLSFKLESAQFIGSDDPAARAGSRDLLAELSSDTGASSIFAFGDLTGRVADWLAESIPDTQMALPLLLDGVLSAKEQHVHAVVGFLDDTAGPSEYVGGVIRQPVSVREAAAAQRLLASEEGIDSSLSGAVGLAALIRAVLTDRQLPPRVRRLPRELSVVAVVTCELTNKAGLACAADALPTRTVSLAEAQSGLPNVLMADGVSRTD